MKRSARNSAAFLALFFLLACGVGTKVDTSKLEQSFQSAPANIKADTDKAAQAIKSGDFKTAVAALTRAVKPGNLTAEQKAAVSEVVSQMQVIASQKPEKYDADVYRSIGDVITIMEGEQPPMVVPGAPGRP